MERHIYVAAKFEERERVKKIYSLLTEAGHKITHDWTNEKESDDPRLLAEQDVTGVVTCDTFVFLPPPKDLHGRGCWVELGIAIALDKTIYVLGEQLDDRSRCIFLRLETVRFVHDEERLITALKYTWALENDRAPFGQ